MLSNETGNLQLNTDSLHSVQQSLRSRYMHAHTCANADLFQFGTAVFTIKIYQAQGGKKLSKSLIAITSTLVSHKLCNQSE